MATEEKGQKTASVMMLGRVWTVAESREVMLRGKRVIRLTLDSIYGKATRIEVEIRGDENLMTMMGMEQGK